MKRILLSLLTVSSLTTVVLPASANSVYVQSGPVGFSVQNHDHSERRVDHTFCRWDRWEHHYRCFHDHY